MMCGFGINTIFQVAIAVVVILVILALLRVAFGQWFASLRTLPYWDVISIVIGGVVAILILLFIWRLAECAGLFGGRVGGITPTFLPQLAFLGAVSVRPSLFGSGNDGL